MSQSWGLAIIDRSSRNYAKVRLKKERKKEINMNILFYFFPNQIHVSVALAKVAKSTQQDEIDMKGLLRKAI